MTYSISTIRKYMLALMLPVLISIIGCSFDKSESPTTPTENTSSVKTQINGIVVDESGKPVNGAVVTAYGKTTTTSKYGTFMFTGIDVPGNRAVISVKKPGFFDAFRAEQPTAGSATYYRIGLMSNTPQGSFTSASGGTITAAGSTATVAFPANGYVKSDGSPYNGTVNYVVRHLNPTSRNFFDFFSGDFRGTRTDGSFTEMVSYGVLRVELTGSNGEKLNLGNGKTATLKYPIASQQSASAPSSMPLWYYDEAKGMWKEEGSATKNGAFYEGTVTHFTDWNCDVPDNTATLTIRVKCDSIPLPGLNVQIGQRIGITNANGIIVRRVPIGLVFTIKAHADQNNGLESNEITVGPFNAGDNQVIDLTMITCPAAIKGTLYECDNNASEFATPGVIVVRYPDGTSSTGYTDENGKFSVIVRATVAFDVIGLTMSGKESTPMTVSALQSNEVRDIGKVSACNSSGVSVLDIEVGEFTSGVNNRPMNTAMTRDGQKLIVRKRNAIEIYEISTGNILKTITLNDGTKYDSVEAGPLEISLDNRYALVAMSYSEWAVYDLNSGTLVNMFSNLAIAHMSDDGSRVIGNIYDYKNLNNNAIVLYNAQTGAELSRITTIDGIKVQYVMQLTDFLVNNTVGVQMESRNTPKMYVVDVNSGAVVSTIAGFFYT
ncbi:MAG: carboxypeptidase regulatory-like domain-containing protein, partial [Candidatus Kapabacteria bacterium]|nr:carboxypeptidase regulatory-like domain-containing protein [Candidatus Kapabacteria bacterium]